MSPSEDEALDLVRRALALRKPGVVASHFHPGEATPAEVVEFLAEREAREGKVKEMKWLGSMDIEGLLLEGVLVVYSEEGAGERRERLAFLAPDDKGVWKVDFDGFARTSRPSWKDLLKGDAEQAVVRVLAAPDVYFNGPFRDESQWVCYAMTSPECKELLSEENSLLRGYCRVDSAQAKAMASIFEGEAKISRATVEIRKTKGAEFRQFEITRVLSREWVVPLTPLDEKFD